MDTTPLDQPRPAEEGVVSTVQTKAREVTEQAQDKAEEVGRKASLQVRDQVDRRSTDAGEQMSSIAQAMRRSAEELRNQGNDTPARLVDQASRKLEMVGGYLTSSDADTILRDVEDFARRQPAVVAGGAAIVGFALARFLGASSRRRFQRPRSEFERATRLSDLPPALPEAPSSEQWEGHDVLDLRDPAEQVRS
jgi:hypothetical protein